MGKSPKISVIVPVYKTEQYLPQCIESILAQTFTDFELLLIVDGSPDCCGEICDRYAAVDKRIRVFHQENAGVSAARNTGLREAKGEYVTFVDSDDYVLPEYINALFNEVSDSAGIVIGSVIKLYPTGFLKQCKLPILNITSKDRYRVLTELVDKNIGYLHSKIYDRNIIKKNKLSFLPTISLLEDFFFLLDYIQYVDTIFIRDTSNYVYRVGYSDSALSVCYKTLEEENEIFCNYYSRVIRCQQEYDLKLSDFKLAWDEIKIFFHRILLTLYTSPKRYCYKERIFQLKKIMSAYTDYINNYFKPDYLSDRIAKFLLMHRLYLCFDLWMRCLLKIHFKYMFGSKNKGR